MELNELLKTSPTDRIYVQCHDNPDPDTVGAAFGVYSYLKANQRDPVLFYSGRNIISKPNMLKMLENLNIPLEYRPELKFVDGLLVTVDCQYGAGNVTKVQADTVAVIDHHIQEVEPPALSDIRPYLGSCSTLVWKLLTDEDFPIPLALSTALYYGLYTDTGALSEVRHPLDRDLRDMGERDEAILRILKNSNLTLEDLSLASQALVDLVFDENGFAVIRTEPCDPNILGFISDLAMQVDKVNVAVVYSENPDGIKYSVRTVIKEAKASDVAAWLAAGGLGSGGGHAEKAGGFISKANYKSIHSDLPVTEFFSKRLYDYIHNYKVIFTLADAGLSYDSLLEYKKLSAEMGFVPCEGLVPAGSVINIRMLEGDISVKVGHGTYLMIGLEGEVYPIEKTKFQELYIEEDKPFDSTFQYVPSIIHRDMGARVSLDSLARSCVSKGGGYVRAQQLDRPVKLFTRWDNNNYLKGEPGDWLVAQSGEDLYIVTKELFPRLYNA